LKELLKIVLVGNEGMLRISLFKTKKIEERLQMGYAHKKTDRCKVSLYIYQLNILSPKEY
jgi:hypothetical protein